MRLAVLALCIGLTHAAQAQDPTLDQITAAVCQAETGTVWNGPGSVSGRYYSGASGESGPWQAMSYTVTALSRDPRRNAASVPYAEATFRAWYSALLQKHGSHAEALAAYHRGSSGRHRKEAKDYAQRVLNLAAVLQQTP
jgi:hypothetical protein